ncbi:MAG: hypothetical protein H0Z53_03000 [Nitrosospira sp.]|nr:hypothetical protein [Nitrosospira sp.]
MAHQDEPITETLSTVAEFRMNSLTLDSLTLLSLPNFGVGHLTIKEAAELIALDMWYSGEIPNSEGPKGWNGGEHDPKLLEFLTQHVVTFETRLLESVHSGGVETAAKRRDFNGYLNSEKTYIKIQNLIDWLAEHGYASGDIMNEWLHVEGEISARICDELIYLRAARKRGAVEFLDIPFPGELSKNVAEASTEITSTIAAYKSLTIENQQLKEQLSLARIEQPAKVDRPLATRQRRTLLTLIAALCDYSAIDLKGKGVAGQIARLTEEIGVNVTDETIAKVLAEIPEVLETRRR